MSNSEHPHWGKEFQKAVFKWLESKPEYKGKFEMEVGLPIGKPEKDHFFDIVNKEERIVIECKRYTWTETGNVPSAKIRALNEAAFFLTFVDNTYTKYIVILKNYHDKKRESLAEYYVRTYRHLLGDIIVAEFDLDKNQLNIIKA
ncbi:hypothetical protein [Ruminococcus albus]|uniref:Restriction endonuclease type IV Mrr domain-containing protein n=1 Tax=Ruminococcus albus TaxID=1264 RepID=A0A1I1EST5_RUMAL|nr:hypothetical protein [Ruminococcus albus]SFB90189.1 hypothetical protein SAMN02910406_00808 [Ruminococcus albus]